MVEPTSSTASPQEPLSEFIADQRPPLMAAKEWAALQVLDALRLKFDGFLGGLSEEEKLEYVQLQQTWIDAQHAVKQAITRFTQTFERQAMGALRAGLKALTGQDIDPAVAQIHTRYLPSSQRVRRVPNEDGAIKVASLNLWEAACRNYDGLTGWSYPGRTGLADASYLDRGINATAAEFIDLVRRLDIGGQLKQQLNTALNANTKLGGSIMGLASAEFEFALIDALKNSTQSHVNRDRYQYVRRALAGQERWQVVQEMQVFIPHGTDNISWLPQAFGFTGQYVAPPPGDYLSIPHLVFSVSGCQGAFSFFPNRPGGSLRHHDSFRTACEEFHVAFNGYYVRGEIDWLYQMISFRDCARLKQIVKSTARPSNLEWFASLVYDLAHAVPRVDHVQKIGFVRNTVQRTPVVCLNDIYIKRGRANLLELANETPGFMPTLIELSQTVLNEVINVLLIPVPGALKGMGMVRSIAMFYALATAMVEGHALALQGEPGELLQGLVDLVDLLISGRLHTRVAKSAQRRHKRLLEQLAPPRSRPAEPARPSGAPLLETMLGTQGAPTRALTAVLASSGTSRETLNQVWEGAPPSASLVDAANRFRADRLIGWVVEGAEPARTVPVGAFEVMAPLLTQLQHWPADTALSIVNQHGLQLRRYSKDAAQPTTVTVTVTALENYQFAYSTPRRLTPHLPRAILALMPDHFPGGESLLRQHLAAQAKALGVELFEALTRFAEVSRLAAKGASASVRRLLPDNVGTEHAVPAVVTQLRALHPQLSLARVLEVLREHPLSAHQQTQLLESQLQPEALYQALRDARRVARREAIVDGLFHGRRFDRQTQNWAASYTQGFLSDLTGRALVVSPARQAVPYVAKGGTDRTIVVIDHRQGNFAPYDPRELRAGEVLTGVDSFFEAIVRQLSDNERTQLGLSARQAIADLRYQLAQAVLRNRALDGSFYPYRREITQYARVIDNARIASEPDALGLYHRGSDRFLFIDGEYFKVAQHDPAQPWHVHHPSLNDAYAPILTHNGAGAWRHEWENPLTWDGQRPFYRLGPWVRALSPDAIEQIQRISGVTSDMLRRVHVCNERPPAILMDTVERFRGHARVKAGVETGADFFDKLLGEVGPDRADALVGRTGVARADQVTVLETKVALDKPLMEHLFFEALCPDRQHSSDPLAQVLQRVNPGLTAWVAEDLVRGVTPAERRSLENGVVPATLNSAIRWWIEYLRKTRALEAVHLPAAANEDSAIAILHALPQIDGWPAHLRVEMWKDGFLRTSVGPADGSLQCIMVAVSNQYQAYIRLANGKRQPTGNVGPFLVALLAALPLAERRSLGYTEGAGEGELLEEVRSRLQRKWEFAETFRSIGRRPHFNAPRRVADGRIGYPLSGRGLRPVERQQVARLRVLYPSRTDDEVLQLWRDAGDSVQERDAMIDYLYQERDAMDVMLAQWRQAAPPGPARDARALAVEQIERCWAKEASTHGTSRVKALNLDGLDLTDLPVLDAHFGHVEVLSLKNNQLSQLPQRFLRCFPGVNRVHLNNNQFAHMPPALSHMPRLMALDLSNNRLKFKLGDVIQLNELGQLRVLDLSSNPLRQGQRLDLSGLKYLRYLNLRNTQLESLPKGAVTLRWLEVFDLRDNQIRVLTRSDLFLFPHVHRAMDLSGNPLSEGTLQMFRQYREQPGRADIHFGLHPHNVPVMAGPDRWLSVLAVRDVASHLALWQELQGRGISDRFFTLIEHIAAHPKFVEPGYRALREDLAGRVWHLIDGAANNAQLATIMFEHPYKMSRGVNGWMVSLNDLELRFRMFEQLTKGGGDAMPLLNCLRAESRLAAIEEAIIRADPDQERALMGTRLLAYRIALSQALDLPLGFDQRLDRTLGTPYPDEVAALRNSILAKEAELNWPELLSENEYWRAFLLEKYQVLFHATSEGYHREVEVIEDRNERAELGSAAYLNLLNDVLRRQRADEIRVVLAVTEGEWGNFKGAADVAYIYRQ